MTKSELQSAVDAMHWYHAISLPHGIVTPGPFPINPEFYKLPEDCVGMRVLDVGTYDGYWAFECMKRGATDVFAIDNFSDAIYPGEKRSWAQFDLCRQALWHSERSVAREETDIDSMNSPLWFQECYERFDLLLFLGTIYHCRSPMLVLDRLRFMAAKGAKLIVESHICDDYSPYTPDGRGHGEQMVMEFYPGSQLAGCATNWWAPTLKCLANMVEAAGFKDVKAWKIANPGEPTYCRGFVQGTAA